MKWKLTGQFLVALVITIVISLFCFMAMNVFLLYSGFGKSAQNLSVQAPQITLDFEKQIVYREGRVELTQQAQHILQENNAWIQVLDENGTQFYSLYTPADAPSHYTPAKLIFYHRFAGAIKGSTIFVGMTQRDGRDLSYVMGFPEHKVAKATINFSPDTFFKDMWKLFLAATLIIVIIASVVGYLFSRRLARPLVKIVDGILHLARGEYTKPYLPKGIYRDVYSHMNHLSDTLEQNERERLKTEQMRGEWITNITHDIRTPLSSIKGYAEILQDRDYEFDTDDRLKYADIIVNKADYIEQLVEDLKLTYQLRQHGQSVEGKRENLIELVRDSIIDVLNHPAYQQADITFEPEAEEVTFVCDRMLLKRAITNLLINALIHNTPETKIVVRVTSGQILCVEVQDYGQGIPKADLQNLFERYYRGTNTGEGHKGSGLGMAIAKQIVEAHGGSIEVNSEAAVGTTVRLLLPV